MSAPAVAVRDLTKRFGRRTAVDRLDLTVETGSVFGLIGPNGAGKSTTMRMLVDVLRPTSGSIEVLGSSPRRGGARLRRRIGYLPGEVTLPRGRGGVILDHLAALSADPSAAHRGRQLADRLGVDLGRPMRALSKGNKQKIAIIQAFMHEPELLLLDEPTSGLDPLVQQTFLDLVREARDNGQTVFLSSHVLSEIQHVADSAAVLNRGALVTVASIDELRRSASRTVRARLAGADMSQVRRALAEHAALAELDAVRPDPERLPVGADADVVDISGAVEGHADELVKALARFRVVELSIQEQDLEESVLSMYRGRQDEPAPEPAREHLADTGRTETHPVDASRADAHDQEER